MAATNNADEACECAGVLPGIFHSPSSSGIQRCDACEVYPGDLEAAWALAERFGPGIKVMFIASTGEGGGHVRLAEPAAREWDGNDLPEGTFIATETNPWLVRDNIELIPEVEARMVDDEVTMRDFVHQMIHKSRHLSVVDAIAIARDVDAAH